MKFFDYLRGRSAQPAAAPAPAPSNKPTVKQQRATARRYTRSQFKAAKASPLDSFTTQVQTTDDVITKVQRILVARSRDQWSNNDYVRNFVRLVRQNVVGQGVLLQAQARKARGGKLDAELNDAIEFAWKEWGKAKNCDVTGKRSFWKLQRVLMNTTVRDGEFIVRKVFGEDAGPWGFALQTVDPQRLRPDYNVQRLRDGGFIAHSIEFNQYGRPRFYHFSSVDESDSSYYQMAGRGFVKVPAENIIHGFVEEMGDQKRGLPWASTSLARMHHLAGFEDAAVQNARASAGKMGFLKVDPQFAPDCDDDGEDFDLDQIDGTPLSFHQLPPGYDLVDWDPNYPSGEYAAFNKAMLRGAAAGMGVLYNNLAGDLEGVNFSSIRQGTLDERDHYKDLQQWLIETLLQEVFDEWLPLALLSGRIVVRGKPVSAAKLDACKAVSWQPRRWQWIDPNADVKAAVESKNNMLASPGQIIRESGRDPQEVWRETAADMAEMKAKLVAEGISEATAEHLVITMMMPGRLPLKEEMPADKPTDKKDE